MKPRRRMYLQRDGIDSNFPVIWNNHLWYSSKYNSGLDVIIVRKYCCSLSKEKRDMIVNYICIFQAVL